MSNQHNDQVRAAAQGILNRSHNDPAFKKQLMDDPIAVLQANGLSEAAAHDYMAETNLGEVVGYRHTAEKKCTVTSCWPKPSFDSTYC